MVRSEVMNEEVEELLNGVSETLNNDNIIELNSRVENDNEEPADVAQESWRKRGCSSR